MKALKYLGLTLMLGACTSPQPKDYYEIVGEVKNVEELESIRNKLLNIRDVMGSRRGQN